MKILLHFLFCGTIIPFRTGVSFIFRPVHFSWNVCFSGTNNQQLIGKTLKTCVDECQQRVRCESVSFDRFSKRCLLHVGPQSRVQCGKKGVLLFRKSDWTQGNFEDSDQTSSSNEGCEALPDPDHGRVVGNLLTTGARVSYRCELGYVPETTSANDRMCLANSSWSQETVKCVCGINGQGEKLSLAAAASIDLGQTRNYRFVVVHVSPVGNTEHKVAFDIGQNFKNITLHVSIRFDNRQIVLNSKFNNVWEAEVYPDRAKDFPFWRDRPFSLLLKCFTDRYTIRICDTDLDFYFPRRRHYSYDDTFFGLSNAHLSSVQWSEP